MKSQFAETRAINVWLSAHQNYAQSSVFCFRDRILLEKRTNVLINSTSCGPIGVKDIVDALRLAPDEEKKEYNGRDHVAAIVNLDHDEMIHVLWTPKKDYYAFYITPYGKAICGEEMDKVPIWKNPFLTLRGIQSCSPITLQRDGIDPSGKFEQIKILVAETCGGIETDIRAVDRTKIKQ